LDQVRRVEAVGIEEIICYFNFALLPHADTLRQMERFSREVMPHVSGGALVAAG
jgi:hypothetical protein